MTCGQKCKELRERLVAWVNGHPGWTLGIEVADRVRAELEREDIYTSGEVLMKELRAACRKGEIEKRIRHGTRYVEYTKVTPNGMLFEPRLMIHGEVTRHAR